ncbi:MAG: cupin domain-containing protein [Haloferacaceae archaeon]
MGRANASDLDWHRTEHGETAFRRKRLSRAAGGETVGCSLYELPAGKSSWPYHYHEGNEEALFVLSGAGRLRTLEGEEPLVAGDYVALPAGEEGGHRVVNEGGEPLRYLAVSTMREPDVTVYPDSGKIGVFAGSPPGGSGERTVSGFFPMDSEVGYWDGEK